MAANQQPTPRRWSVQEYLEAERRSEDKHEYLDGRVYLMAGGTPDHNRICANTIAALISALGERGCDVFTSDQKVRVGAARFVYPDVTVVCGQAEFDEDVLLNPTLIVEVLSETTAARDRGEKGFAYRACPSLQGYVLIEQSEPRIEGYFRQTDGSWQVRDVEGIESALDLPPLAVTVALGDLYRRIAFDPTLGGDESPPSRP
jgi:Uma2 family endonuclease